MPSSEAYANEALGSVWYAEGLLFTCTRCCRCCSGPPGYVWVTPLETARMAAFLGISDAQFGQLYCRDAWLRVSLKERANGDCIFLMPQGCAVYDVRPIQCRTFPFWPENLRSGRSWDALKARCPGVGRGKTHSLDEIERITAGERST
jgi:hypothetical protein